MVFYSMSVPISSALSPATGDPLAVIGIVAGVSVVAMIILTILSKRAGRK